MYAHTMSTLKIGSLNVRGLQNHIKRKRLFHKIRLNKYGVFFLQETHSTQSNEQLWIAEWGGKGVLHSYGSSARGTGILFNSRLTVNILDQWVDTEGRTVIVKVTIDEIDYVFANIYAPNRDNPDYFTKIFSEIDKMGGENVVVGGDYNLVLDMNLDCDGRLSNNFKSSMCVQAWMEESKFSDPWRVLNPDLKKYTWGRRQTGCKSRLDMIMVNDGLLQFVTKANIIPESMTDHSLVEIYIEKDPIDRGQGYWKLNCSLLRKEDNIKLVRAKIQELNTLKCQNHTEKWETIKQEVKTQFQEIGKQQKQYQENELYNLQQSYAFVHNEIYSNNFANETCDYLEDLKIQIDRIETSIAQSAAFRAKARWVKEGEKNTRYFLAMEKRNYMSKCISKLNVAGQIITQQNKILNEMKMFYSELYTKDEMVKFTIHNTRGTKISPLDKAQLEKDISIDECYSAINNMKLNKAPGCDGLPVEFYRLFWEDIKLTLFETYKETLTNGMLNSSARIGIVSLIPKKNKSPLELRNWRPLTLLNVDYKILAKVAATRLQKVLPTIISDTQTGFMQGRNITDSIRKTMDVVSYINNTGKQALLINIDYEKCFDKIAHQAVYGALEYFGIGPNFVDLIRVFFHDFKIVVGNAGHYSTPSKKTRGVNQGCPISPYLFLLCAEIMSHKIKENPNIQGIQIGEVEHLISQFADDTTIFIGFSQLSLNGVIEVLAYVEANTGLKVSYDKTTIHRLGSLRKSNAMLYTQFPVIWTDDDIKTLGVTISNSTVQSNCEYDNNITKMCNVLDSWYLRRLTITGKVLIVNTLLASIFVYRMYVLPWLSAKQSYTIDCAIKKFLWTGKKAKINSTILQCRKSKGGLGLVNFKKKQQSIRLSWVKKAVENESFSYVSTLLNVDLGPLIWCVNICKADTVAYECECKQMLPFWFDIWSEWCSHRYRKNFSHESPWEEIIWFNSNIRIGNKIVYFKKAAQAGIIRYGDLFDNMDRMYTYEDLIATYGDCINWLQYNSIKIAIEKYVNATKTEHEPILKEESLLCAKPIKIIYKTLCDHKTEQWLQPAKDKLEILIQTTLTWADIYAMFKRIYTTTSVTKLRDFQYRLILNRLYTNNILVKWGLVPDNKCEFCTEKQTIMHLFFDCKTTQAIYQSFTEMCREAGAIVNINRKTLFSGQICEDKICRDVLNCAFLIVKQYIYRCKCQKRNPRWDAAKSEILYYEKIEKMYCLHKQNTFRQHVAKWLPLKPELMNELDTRYPEQSKTVC